MRRRTELLIHPVFTGAVALLALNDQVLKASFPGLVTGKLSDVAGVVMVAVVAYVVSGHRRAALAVTAAAFVALKTTLPVAELVAPALGGVTRRDPTDLVALAALLPLARWLRRAHPGPVASPAGPPAKAPAMQRSASSVVMTFVAMSAAVFATTGSSCDADPVVIGIMADSERVVAILRGARHTASTDGGLTWDETADAGSGTASRPYDPPETSSEACGEAGVCWRTTPGERLERCVGGRCELAYSFSDDQDDKIQGTQGCGYSSQRGGWLFSEVTVVERPEGEVPIVAMGTEGLLVGGTDGSFDRVGVQGANPTSFVLPLWTGTLLTAPLWVVLASPLFLFGLLVKPRRRAVAATVFCLLAGLVASGVVLAWTIFQIGDDRFRGVISAAVAMIIFAVSLGLALSRRRERPAEPAPGAPDAASAG